MATQKQGRGRPKYKMTSNQRGICLIINNISFAENLSDRTGAAVDDEVELERVFTYLGFIVEVKRDQTAQEMTDVMDEMRRRDHSQYDCFVCCILSDGRLGEVFGSDGKTCNMLQLASNLRADKCESLHSKPKVFFIQASRTKEKDDSFDNIPNDVDFLFGYSTAPKTKEMSNTKSGSVFIRTLTRVLKERHQTNHILDMLTRVNREVSQLTGCQVPSPQFTLTKDLYFPVAPWEIQARGPEAVKAFNEALLEGETEVSQGRTIFVGLEGVGKTSTINSLLRKSFNPKHDITDAIATTRVCTQESVDDIILEEKSQETAEASDIGLYENVIAREVVKRVKEKQNTTISAENDLREEQPETLLTNATVESHVETQLTQNPDLSTKTDEECGELAYEEGKEKMQSEIPPNIHKLLEIEFQKEGSDNQESNNKFVMNIWDFGGQPIYHVIQRIFMVSFAVICVVFNLCHDLEAPAMVLDPTTGKMYKHRMTNLDFILYWICSIYTNSRSDAKKIEGLLCPHVLLIGTHLNGLKGSEAEKKRKLAEIKKTIQEALKGKPYRAMSTICQEQRF
ncbi:uncharacterized protein [Antedon mediterranea]|uniref:uncharacterized protein n=1 Tax=Antedon mediterranea TaxID=105859 RepID=UPI003AF546FB